jgi:3-phenylpropionate/cinnamic acid dioxygenase small subunit
MKNNNFQIQFNFEIHFLRVDMSMSYFCIFQYILVLTRFYHIKALRHLVSL